MCVQCYVQVRGEARDIVIIRETRRFGYRRLAYGLMAQGTESKEDTPRVLCMGLILIGRYINGG